MVTWEFQMSNFPSARVSSDELRARANVKFQIILKMAKDDTNKKNATTQAQKQDETSSFAIATEDKQKFSASEKLSDSAVAREISELKQKVSEFEDKYKRALADYQNLEKRVREERVDWLKTANKEMILRLLPILDTLMLAQKHSKDQSLAVSIGLFLDTLKAEGVEKIETNGKEFDPQMMEVVATGEGQENGKVLEELRSGYTIVNRVLRPAQVKVGKESA